jgi:hypothetical protein
MIFEAIPILGDVKHGCVVIRHNLSTTCSQTMLYPTSDFGLKTFRTLVCVMRR